MGRDIVIGDIHGCYAELEQLLERVELRDEDRLISVGDLVDRGPDSVRVWELFRDRPKSVALMGNHERKHLRGVLSYSQEIVKLQFGPRYPEFLAWIARLPYYLETPDAIIVHGGFEDGVPLADQREEVLAGTMSGSRHLEQLYAESYWPERYTGDKAIVFGHHVVGDAVECWGDKVWGLDTGACHGRFLSALVLPSFERVSVPAARDYWAEQKRRWQLPVLRSWPWHEFSAKKMARERAALDRRPGEDVAAFKAALDAWLAELDAQIPALIERIRARHDAMLECFEDRSRRVEVAAQPCPGLLFACHRGSLSPELVRTQLGTPALLRAACESYGLELALSPPHAL